MPENQRNTSEIGATPETNQDILARQPASVQKIVEKDPILSKNLDQITNPKEFFEKLAQSAHIFEQTDNIAAQKTFLEQSLKGLGYGQYTQDGRKFETLKPEDLEGLSRKEKMNYALWIQAKNQMEQEGLQQDEAKNQMEQEGLQQDEAKLIDLQEKNAKAGEENQKIIDTLSPNGKSFLDTELQKARTDINNPVYRDLVSKGIDPNKGDFDNILRASIILANAETLKKESNNQDVFNNSLRELGKLGILYPVKSDIPSISTHIDSRFPRTEATERAKGEITRSIESEKVASIYYDGKGEKYTLIDKDGKTSKEIYMNPPPRMEIVKNGLRISRDIEPVSPEEQKRKEGEKNLANKKGSREKAESAYFETISTEAHKNEYETIKKDTTIDNLLKQKNQLVTEYINLNNPKAKQEKIGTIKELLQKMSTHRESILGIDTSNEQGELANAIESIVGRETILLNTLNKSLSDELQAEQSLPPEPATRKLDTRFESVAQYNLNFLSYIGYDTLGQDELERIIERLNSPSNPRRSEVGEIDLSDRLDTPKTQALTLAIANLVRGGRQSSAPTSPEQTKQEQSQKTWDSVDKTDHIIAARQTQSFGFRETLLSVRRNMTQEGGSLKTRGQLDKALFGIESAPEVNNSALNTISDNSALA